MEIEGILSRDTTDYVYDSYISKEPEADPVNPTAQYSNLLLPTG